MINRVIINGNLGKDPEITKTSNGKSVCTVSICQNKKDKNGNQSTEWFKIEAWERTADFLGQYCRKGDMIIVDGHMKYKEWEKDGQRKTSEAIIADTITLERRGQNHVDSQPSTYGQPVQYEQTQPQPIQPQSFPAYTQQSMMQGSMIPTEVNIGNPNPVDDFGIPEYTGGLDISGDDLPF